MEDYEPSFDLSGISNMSEAVRITGREMPPTENINQTLGDNYSWLVSAFEHPDAAARMLQVPVPVSVLQPHAAGSSSAHQHAAGVKSSPVTCVDCWNVIFHCAAGHRHGRGRRDQ